MADAPNTTTTESTPPPEPKTALEARQRLNDLARDPDFSKRLLGSDVEAKAEAERLAKIAAGVTDEQRVDAALAGNLATPIAETLSGGQRSASEINSAVQYLRELGLSPGAAKEAFIRPTATPREAIEEARRMHKEMISDPEQRAALLRGDAAAVRRAALLSIVMTSPAAT